jgi:nucleoside-diphosphate-sugar epimerase
MKVLVIGGAGFIGRSVVVALVASGCEVTVGTRRSHRPGATSKTQLIELHRLTRSVDWLPRLKPFDVVVNCAGILRERWGESYGAVYLEAPVAIATACAALSKRFIHVTALGLTAGAGSGFITAKLAGEQALDAIVGEMCIVRPSLLDGVDGFGSRWLRRVAQWPAHCVPADAAGRLAPLHVHDLGAAIAALCACSRERLPKSVELGGETHYSLAQYMQALRAQSGAATLLPVPAWLVRCVAHVLDVLHLTPLSWGHVELLRRDNLPRPDDRLALRRWIGRAPRSLGVGDGGLMRATNTTLSRSM